MSVNEKKKRCIAVAEISAYLASHLHVVIDTVHANIVVDLLIEVLLVILVLPPLEVVHELLDDVEMLVGYVLALVDYAIG